MEDYLDDEETAETDEEYEFEAPQFYDFTLPESDYEVEEAERWFEVSGDYPPSPFILKLNLEKLMSVEVSPKLSKSRSSNTSSISSSSDNRVSGAKGKRCKTPQTATTKVKKTRSDGKLLQPRSCPSFMEPTASNLAKQKVNHKHSDHICTRFQKISAKIEQKASRSPPGFDNNPATKRQKLDIGFSIKVAHLKHQFSLKHKSTKKVTIQKEPGLETMIRAQRRRSKASTASSETESQKQKSCNFKARPLNKKILQRCLSAQPKRSPPQLPEFQVFHLKTLERANSHGSAKVHVHPSTIDICKHKDVNRKSTILRRSVSGSSTRDKQTMESPPTEQLSKLSLGPNMKSNTVSASTSSQSSRRSSVKSQKKGEGNPFRADFKRCNAKPKQCGVHMALHEAKSWSDMSRSLGIH